MHPLTHTLSAAALVAFSCGACGAPPPSTALPVHHSPIAGSWYPGDAASLKAMLKTFFDAAAAESKQPAPPGLAAIIVPHAGYRYSGGAAAQGYARLAAREPAIRRIVIIGPSHSVPFSGVSIGAFRAYATPLGETAIDVEAVERLRRSSLVQNIPAVHKTEHSVDIQVPLIQYAFAGRVPLIVPIVCGALDGGQYTELAEALRGICDARTAIVVSSDFTHFGPRFDYMPFAPGEGAGKKLRALNDEAARAIESGRRDAFLKHLRETGNTICGARPIALLLETLPSSTTIRRIAYATSADAPGTDDSVVVYQTFECDAPKGWPAAAQATVASAEGSLTEEEQQALLTLARDAMLAAVRGESAPPLDACKKHPALREKRAAFVTLTRNGELRGCIGSIFPEEALCESVRRHALNAAIHDYRFSPVGPAEAPGLHIEISALTVPGPVNSYRDIRIGADGIVLQQDDRRAVFLPQVAPEQGWTLEETVTHLSRKAGLPPNAWKSPSCRFLTFQAEVFGEPAPKKH